MKAPAFDYAKPTSLAGVFELLQRHGDAARVLAGGQTLLATLAMRLSEPALLIDLAGIAALSGIALDGDRLRIGAMTTHSAIEASPLVAEHVPLLAQAAPHIAHRAIRNRGTLGGSIAYADPASEWPACLLALDATVVVQGADGERRIAADEFFLDLYTTALGPGEIVTACEFAQRTSADVCHFDELARRLGDYASVGLAVTARRDGAALRRVRLAFLGLGSTPLRARAAEAALEGRAPDTATIASALAALAAELDPHPDLTHTAATKRHLAGVLVRRALLACRETADA